MTWFGWRVVWSDRFFKNIWAFVIIDFLLKMSFVYDLFIAVVSDFFLEPGFIALDIKVNKKFSFKVNGDNVSRSSNSIFQKIFYNSKSWESVYKDDLFLVGRIDFGKGDFHFVWSEIGIIGESKVTILTSVKTLQSFLVEVPFHQGFSFFFAS